MMEPNLIPLTAQFSGGISNVVPRCYGCTTFTTTYDDFEWPDDDIPPTGGGGGNGGGGSSEPPETDCTGVQDCGLGSRIVEGRVPCGDCGPGPIVIVPPEDDMDANGFYYSRIAELDSILAANPFALEPCDSLSLINLQTYGGMYQQVAGFAPGQAVRDRLDSLRSANTWWPVDNYNILSLENAYGAVVNCDLFPIQISQFPINTSTQIEMTPAEFLEYFRMNVNSFISPSVGVSFNCNLSAQVNDCYKWNLPKSQSIGALSHIHIPGPIGSSDDGTVILCDYQQTYISNAEHNYFKFSTIQTPFDGYHPVAGNREFGIYNTNANLGEFTFYIMGVDRTSNFVSDLANVNQYGFKQGDTLWLNVTNNMNLFVNNNGGQSTFYSQKQYIARPFWIDVQRYLRKKIIFSELKTLLGC